MFSAGHNQNQAGSSTLPPQNTGASGASLHVVTSHNAQGQFYSPNTPDRTATESINQQIG